MAKTRVYSNHDRHDANFYSAIWESINRTGGWEGEIWNRRKSGEVYPEFITIAAVKDPSSITTNYVATFNDITERKRADQKFATAYRKIQQLALRLDNVREEERVRIASELHDEMGATLTALKMRVRWLVTKLPAEMVQFVEEVENIDLLLTDAVHTMRHVVSQLMPTLLHDLGFTAAIERCVQDFQKLTGIECVISLPEEDLTLDDKQASSMFRTLQESLNNIAKHSQASKVSILFIDRVRSLILLVKDNGVGFDKSTNKANSFGLLCILERARMVNGKARISSRPGKGTQVVFSIPLAEN